MEADYPEPTEDEFFKVDDEEEMRDPEPIEDAKFVEIYDEREIRSLEKKRKIGYILIAILGVGLFFGASFLFRSCGSSNETKAIHSGDAEAISDSVSNDGKIPTAFPLFPFDSTKPVTKDSFALVWNREVEVLIPPNNWFWLDFDQTETLRVRLKDGRVFEGTNNQWFFQGKPVSGLSEIPGLSIFLSSRKNMDVTFIKRPK